MALAMRSGRTENQTICDAILPHLQEYGVARTLILTSGQHVALRGMIKATLEDGESVESNDEIAWLESWVSRMIEEERRE